MAILVAMSCGRQHRWLHGGTSRQHLSTITWCWHSNSYQVTKSWQSVTVCSGNPELSLTLTWPTDVTRVNPNTTPQPLNFCTFEWHMWTGCGIIHTVGPGCTVNYKHTERSYLGHETENGEFKSLSLYFVDITTWEADLSNSTFTCLGKHQAVSGPRCSPLVPTCCICSEKRTRPVKTDLSKLGDMSNGWQIISSQRPWTGPNHIFYQHTLP